MAHAADDGRVTKDEFTYIVRTATQVVAASDALASSKALSDHECLASAIDNDVEINAAIAALPA